jgi:hypothetical protein
MHDCKLTREYREREKAEVLMRFRTFAERSTWKKARISRELGVSLSTVDRWLHGHNKIMLASMLEIRRFLEERERDCSPVRWRIPDPLSTKPRALDEPGRRGIGRALSWNWRLCLDNPGGKFALYMPRLSKRWQLSELHWLDDHVYATPTLRGIKFVGGFDCPAILVKGSLQEAKRRLDMLIGFTTPEIMD